MSVDSILLWAMLAIKTKRPTSYCVALGSEPPHNLNPEP